MKTFWKALVVVAIVFAISGCDKSSGTKPKLVGDVTVSYEGRALTTDNGITINTGETVTLAASADNADYYSFQPATSGVVTIDGLSITGAVSGTEARPVIITCTATNDKDAQTTAFTVTVRPKLASFDVNFGSEPVDYETGISRPLNTDVNLHLTFTPAAAEDSFEWDIPEEAGVTVTDYTSDAGARGKTFKATADAEVSITVTPTQAGLTVTEINNLTKSFKINFSSSIVVTPVTNMAIHYGDENGSVVANNGRVELKRGRTVALYAAPDVVEGTEVRWEFTDAADVVTNDVEGRTSTFEAADGDTGTTVTVTVSADNPDNDAPFTQTFTLAVPDRGSTLFEWYAAENPDEENLGSDRVRNYPGFRDVYIQSRGAIMPVNGNEVEAATSTIGDFKGMRIGTWMEGANQRLPRLMIGAAVNVDGEGTASAAITGEINASSADVGTLDLLDKPVKITVEYDSYNFGSEWIRFYVNNNGSSAGNSNIGNASQFQHYNTGANARFFSDDCRGDNSGGTWSYLLDYNNPTGYAGSNIGLLDATLKPQLEKAFIGIVVQNSQGASYIDVTGIKIEYVASAGITVNNEAKFGDFPDAPFTLSGAETKTITLSGSTYTKTEWYIDGRQVSGATNAYTVEKGSLSNGEHSLTALVTVDGKMYSKTVRFTVAD